MIRLMKHSQVDRVMDIWLEGNQSAHDFIPGEYWDANYASVRQALPEATVYIYEEGGVVLGFVGIVDRAYIAGLFVASEVRSNGIGSRLIGKCKEEFPVLELHVYAKNLKAVNFYKKHDFSIIHLTSNTDTGELEYTMRWECK